ncbi:type II toxin-antitoxin system HicA family toxin [Ancylobacter mangrovi]|uniref:type II toxin-antitoxin system HicA family toxin n=1 Tax=Ancylobacter mangrovi TaxID=2972472 RepID=UPI0021623639|nr:type II toxin-antitoxin system HicA family toxin [Ancylobacter mangrovi]MCS0501395.1 type II toxin-antitoxin system HicA family toxin [Ancylobacter mangrovi]
MGRSKQTNKRRDLEKRLRAEGWEIVRRGPGDHVQYKHPTRPGRVTIDTGLNDIPTGTLKSICKQAGWEW